MTWLRTKFGYLELFFEIIDILIQICQLLLPDKVLFEFKFLNVQIFSLLVNFEIIYLLF